MRVEGRMRGAAWFPEGIFATLLSPPQCHAAFRTMPHIMASAAQSPVRHPRTLSPSPLDEDAYGLIIGGVNITNHCNSKLLCSL
jgi:hypothetical protein